MPAASEKIPIHSSKNDLLGAECPQHRSAIFLGTARNSISITRLMEYIEEHQCYTSSAHLTKGAWFECAPLSAEVIAMMQNFTDDAAR